MRFPRLVRLFIVAMAVAACWTAVIHIERVENPAGFDLEMQLRIEDTQKIVEQSLEARSQEAP